MKKIIIIFIIGVTSLNTYAQVVASDSLALVEIYNSTGGATWTHHENWLSGPVPTWFGITVSNKRVTKLELCTDCYVATSGNNMAGGIPAAIGDLTKLTNIVMSGNKLTGNIPAEIGNLTDLYWLDLAGNKLENHLPASIGNLVHLNSLLLAFNKLDGELPKEIGNLTSLEHLSLGWNSFTGNIPVEIGGLGNLKQLQLNNNQFNGSIPKEIGNFTNLFDLSLQDNQLSGEIPREIGNLTSLTSLTLNINNLNGIIPTEFGNLTHLYTLFVYSNQLTGSIPHEIGQLASLTSFAAYNNQLSGSLPDEIGNLTNLTMLSLYNNKLTGVLPSSLGNLVGLQNLALSDNQFDGPLPASLGSLTNLDMLDVSNNQLNGAIPASIGDLKIARYLVLDRNNFTGALPVTFSNLPALEYLRLENNQLTDLPDLSGDTQLWHLSLQYNKFTFEDIEPNVAINGVSYLPQNVTLTAEGQHLTEGDTFTASFNVGGSFNQYQWWKDGMTVAGSTQPILTIPSVALDDAGYYELRITNTSVPDLFLVTEPVILSVTSAPYAEVQVHSDTTTLVNNGVLMFSTVVTGSSADTQLVISNTGTAPLSISSIVAGGDFSVSFTESLPVTLAPGTSMDVLCRFTSIADGTVTGNLSIASDANQPVFLLNLIGTSYTPPPALFPEIKVSNDTATFVNNGELTFPQVVTGESVETSVMISNTGTAPLIVSSITSGSDYSVSFTETLPVTLAPGASMDVLCRFSPTADGKVSGRLLITNDTNQPVFQLNLIGMSITPAQPTPVVLRKPGLVIMEGTSVLLNDAHISFPLTSRGAEQSKQFDISNDGDTLLVIGSLAVTGDFRSSPTGIITLQPGEHQTVKVDFIPSEDGDRPGSLTIVSNADSLPRVMNLSGVGFTQTRCYVVQDETDLIVSAGIAFEVTEVGSQLVKRVSLINTGNTTISIESFEVSGPFSIGNDQDHLLEAGQKLEIKVAFAPDQIGDHNGSLTIRTDSDTPTVTFGLTGVGEADIEVYNMVTTRVNGRNDFLEIRNINLFPSNQVHVFDRWGNKVYSKHGYDNVNDTFRGVSDRGNVLPDGTYFYLIDKKNGSEQVTGFLVVRN
jgi:gliding motility-associated-like protein